MYQQPIQGNTFLSYVDSCVASHYFGRNSYDALKARAWVKWCDGIPLTPAESDLLRPRPLPTSHPPVG